MAFSRPLSFLSRRLPRCLQLARPAGATVGAWTGVSVDIKVYVSNANDGSPVPEKVVYYEELARVATSDPRKARIIRRRS